MNDSPGENSSAYWAADAGDHNVRVLKTTGSQLGQLLQINYGIIFSLIHNKMHVHTRLPKWNTDCFVFTLSLQTLELKLCKLAMKF